MSNTKTMKTSFNSSSLVSYIVYKQWKEKTLIRHINMFTLQFKGLKTYDVVLSIIL